LRPLSIPRASLPLAVSELPAYDLPDYRLDPVPVLDPLEVYLIPKCIHHLPHPVTLGLHAGSQSLPGPVLLPDLALHVLHLFGVLRRQLLEEDNPLVQALVEGRLLQKFVCQVPEVQELHLVRVKLI